MKTKKSRTLVLLFTLSLGGTFLGCSTFSVSPKPVIKYAIDYSPSSSISVGALPVILKVDRFGAAPGFTTPHMIYSTGPFERNTYVYHRWFSPPAQMTAYALTQDLRAKKAFAAVIRPGDGIKATHVLTGGITDFYERDEPTGWVAVLGISILLFTESSIQHEQQVLLEKQYNTEIPCKSADAPAFAAAMNRAIQALSDQIVTDLYNALLAQTDSTIMKGAADTVD